MQHQTYKKMSLSKPFYAVSSPLLASDDKSKQWLLIPELFYHYSSEKFYFGGLRKTREGLRGNTGTKCFCLILIDMEKPISISSRNGHFAASWTFKPGKNINFYRLINGAFVGNRFFLIIIFYSAKCTSLIA